MRSESMTSPSITDRRVASAAPGDIPEVTAVLCGGHAVMVL
ncbi:hypothetical protein BDFB_014113 [Asbolus verrucosus]|uniref:Uncharacterized protein n=1 Tax=Asbolus verrucosus TaxID=1661398 RepID=A0A482WET5_ASBVE|nr:hypothetical protein BDFB_014113 [Asbolus verrucosus]